MISSLRKALVGRCGAYIDAARERQAIRRGAADPGARNSAACHAENYNNFTKMNRV
jgi:hypothetical protein